MLLLVSVDSGLDAHLASTVPPALRTCAAGAQKPAMSNQCAAVPAVMRSTLESWVGGETSVPNLPPVDTSKWMGLDVDEVLRRGRAVLIMPSEESRPMACAKCGARLRVTVPGPQPTSRRVSRFPPVEVW